MEVASLGALFLLSALLPAYLGNPGVIPTDGTNTPQMIVLGIGGAAGVGALLSLTGQAVWNFLWPISPTGGWVHVYLIVWTRLPGRVRTGLRRTAEGAWSSLPRRVRGWFPDTLPATFRARIAQGLGPYWDLTDQPRWDSGDRAVIATAFLLYSEAPDQVREWIRRRHSRFADALSATAAIVLGILAGSLLDGHWNLARGVVVAALVVVTMATYVFAHQGRREAVDMETYWFKVRTSITPPEVITHVVLDPPDAATGSTSGEDPDSSGAHDGDEPGSVEIVMLAP